MSEAKVIVVTGATRGLGRALVTKFVEAGHTVIGCGRNANHISELSEQFTGRHRFDAIDITNYDKVAAWGAEVVAEYGPPDLLVNNAALLNDWNVLWKIEPAEFDALIDVNLKGLFYVIRSFVPAMVERQQGVIVNFSSGWGRMVSAEVAPYCCSKYGVEGMTLAMAKELPPDMAAVPLSPGVVNTDMQKQCIGDRADGCPSPADWAAKAAPFLLQLGPSDNGQSLTCSV
ncbi:SDR family oxidoreductase [Blastopirellula retiformator]|uniref:3-oxoacyl-[acyl-carrier-protein] reductase FabG n=1 Tax=Blastopirellula retiformator TaxID=2527970 RepID=A0A5C5V7K1_9BACT|nr:SDR family oxidoreductase [Blastopirellula retiformator]TWT34251.1 3-oxoacyl-[acyl-carrier-protein] reductase FabG [Blastopirellula retiformator]